MIQLSQRKDIVDDVKNLLVKVNEMTDGDNDTSASILIGMISGWYKDTDRLIACLEGLKVSYILRGIGFIAEANQDAIRELKKKEPNKLAI